MVGWVSLTPACMMWLREPRSRKSVHVAKPRRDAYNLINFYEDVLLSTCTLVSYHSDVSTHVDLRRLHPSSLSAMGYISHP